MSLRGGTTKQPRSYTYSSCTATRLPRYRSQRHFNVIMPKIELLTKINAPIEKVFDLSRSIDLHIESTKQTGERAIAGCTSGLIELGETVTWRAKHFGIWQNLTSKITAYNCPTFFADEMVSGTFKSFRHEHHFSTVDNHTLMKDIFVFESPFGMVGRLFNWLVLKRYMASLLVERNRVIKETAEYESV
jgi:ligand-binding SRPBCC domain-containing protein